MILNQLEEWRGQGASVHAAFKGPAEKVRFRAGMRIYKFNGYPTLLPPGAPEWSRITPWWSPYEAYEWDAGLENRRKVALSMGGATLKELSRIVVAVKENWSSLDHLVDARLARPVHAFFGSVAPQARLDPGSASHRAAGERPSIGGGKLIGTGSQFYIPNLRLAHLTDVAVTRVR